MVFKSSQSDSRINPVIGNTAYCPLPSGSDNPGLIHFLRGLRVSCKGGPLDPNHTVRPTESLLLTWL